MTQALGLADVTVVTVSFNSAAMMAGMLATIAAGVQTVVVDNGSEDDTAEVALAAYATLVRPGANVGFGRGCNAGAATARTPFLFFVNPDARLEPRCIEELLAAAERWPQASAFNPRIVNPSGRVEYKWRSVLVPRSSWLARRVPDVDTELPALAGGAFFCRRDCFEKVGGFDPAIFLFHEDDDLAIRMRAACGPLIFVPSATVNHAAGRSSGRSPAMARFRGYHIARSRIYAMNKHGQPLPWLRTALSAAAGLAAPYNFFSGRRRAKYIGQWAGAWSALRDGGKYE